MGTDKEVSVGILAIGSLYWDGHLARTQWRKARLVSSQALRVRAPIRYGRRSASRANTYTTVFSQLCTQEGKWGTALVLPCRNRIRSNRDLIEEAELLWAAECKETHSTGGIAKTWGAVGLLAGPSQDIPEELLSAWKTRVTEEGGYGNLGSAIGENPIISALGMLQIPWPEPVEDVPLPLDLLLAAATKPTLVASPNSQKDAEAIAEAWRQAPSEQAYFWRNRRSGICTFQDELIAQRLRG